MAELFFGGGLNETDTINVDEGEAIAGENFKVAPHTRVFSPRAPLDLKFTAPNFGGITGILQLIKRDDSETTLIAAGDKVYDWGGTEKATIITDSRLRETYWSLDDHITITDLDLNNVVHKWDGTTYSKQKHALFSGSAIPVASVTRSGGIVTVTTAAPHGYVTDDLASIFGAVETDYNGQYQVTVTGDSTFTYNIATTPFTPATGTITTKLGIDLYAKYGIVMNGRMWLFNVKTDSDANPHMVIASAFEDAESYDTSERNISGTFADGSEAFFMLSPDLKPINGMALIHDTLIISTENGRTFRLTGTDANSYNWEEFYAGSAASGTETMANIGNDVVFTKVTGNVDSLSSTDRFGDVSADDLTRWIPVTAAASDPGITVYDQQNQIVFFFTGTKVLVLDKEAMAISKLSPWSIYTTKILGGFATKSARYMREPNGTKYSVYWGNGSGNLYDMNGTTLGDDGSNITTFRKTRLITELDTINNIVSGRLKYRRRGPVDLEMAFEWAEEYNVDTVVVPLKPPLITGTPSFYGTQAVYGTSDLYGAGSVSSEQVSTLGFSPAGKGIGFFLELRADTTVDFFVNSVGA